MRNIVDLSPEVLIRVSGGMSIPRFAMPEAPPRPEMPEHPAEPYIHPADPTNPWFRPADPPGPFENPETHRPIDPPLRFDGPAPFSGPEPPRDASLQTNGDELGQERTIESGEDNLGNLGGQEDAMTNDFDSDPVDGSFDGGVEV